MNLGMVRYGSGVAYGMGIGWRGLLRRGNESITTDRMRQLHGINPVQSQLLGYWRSSRLESGSHNISYVNLEQVFQASRFLSSYYGRGHPRARMGAGYSDTCRPITPFSISWWFSNHKSETSQGSQNPKPKSYFQLFKFSRNPGSCWGFGIHSGFTLSCLKRKKSFIKEREYIYIYNT